MDQVERDFEVTTRGPRLPLEPSLRDIGAMEVVIVIEGSCRMILTGSTYVVVW